MVSGSSMGIFLLTCIIPRMMTKLVLHRVNAVLILMHSCVEGKGILHLRTDCHFEGSLRFEIGAGGLDVL